MTSLQESPATAQDNELTERERSAVDNRSKIILGSVIGAAALLLAAIVLLN